MRRGTCLSQILEREVEPAQDHAADDWEQDGLGRGQAFGELLVVAAVIIVLLERLGLGFSRRLGRRERRKRQTDWTDLVRSQSARVDRRGGECYQTGI
jgi:hypothetical protein